MIQHKFDVMFLKVFWSQFTTYGETHTLDGTLGVTTTDMTDLLKSTEDIAAIYRDGTNTTLSLLPTATLNPATITGTTPQYFSGNTDVTKRWTTWPKASTGDVQVTYRTRPATYELEDEVDFDEQTLILGAAFDYAEDDGTNPAATDKLQGLFESRVQQLYEARNIIPIKLDNTVNIPTAFSFVELP
tara:strand:- start:100 stop:660 length:561 start_codon:yes stop_codon:yes gene_type:complete